MLKRLKTWWKKVNAWPGTPEGCSFGKHKPVCIKKREVPSSNPKFAKYGIVEDERLFVCENPDCPVEKWIGDEEYWADAFGGPDWRKNFK